MPIVTNNTNTISSSQVELQPLSSTDIDEEVLNLQLSTLLNTLVKCDSKLSIDSTFRLINLLVSLPDKLHSVDFKSMDNEKKVEFIFKIIPYSVTTLTDLGAIPEQYKDEAKSLVELNSSLKDVILSCISLVELTIKINSIPKLKKRRSLFGCSS
jgi:hypothetical protein